MLYFEDMPVGHKEVLPPRVISKDEIIGFASKYDPQPHHLDEEAAKDSILGGLAASGWHACCALIRMAFDARNDEVAMLGSPGIEEVRWRAPVFPGDELSAICVVTEARASKSKPHMGVIKRHYEMTKADGTVVLTMDAFAMIGRRPGNEDAA